MTRRIWFVLLVGIVLTSGSLAAAAMLPGEATTERAGRDAPVLNRRVRIPSRPSVSDRRGAPPVSTTTTPSPTSTTSTTSTTRPGPRPGPLSAPRPVAAVVLDDATPVLDRVPTQDKVIFLGIDDGLARDPAVLAWARRERIPMTLFLTVEPARQGREFFQALVETGATVQAHTRYHPRLPTLGWSDQDEEVCGQLDELTGLYGLRPTLFRPPYGEWNATTQAVAGQCGLEAIVLWRGATNDGRLDIVGDTFHPGDVLLLHFRPDLLANLQLVAARARAEGYRVGRIEDYLGTGPEHPMFPPEELRAGK